MSHETPSSPLLVSSSGSPPTHEKKEATYSSRTAYALGINYIIGTGVFSLPFAFYESGLVLGIVCTLVGGFFSLCCLNWMFEALSRTEGLHVARAAAPVNGSPRMGGTSTGDHVGVGLARGGRADDAFRPHHRGPEHLGGEAPCSTDNDDEEARLNYGAAPCNQLSTTRRYDMSYMFEYFFGLKGLIVCQAALSFYTYSILWAYSAVFASTVASLFYQFAYSAECDIYAEPSYGCNVAYYVSVVVFACYVLPMACLDVGEQASVQIFLTIYRFSAFAVMLATVFVALASGNPYVAIGQQPVSTYAIAKWGGFGTMFTSAIVALCMHYTTADIVHPITDKKNAQRALMGSMVTSIGFYLLIGLVCACYFGQGALPLVTLNWTEYTGRGGGWQPIPEGEKRVWWSILVQFWVMLFPVFDMASVYPLVCVTLANNLYASTPKRLQNAVPERVRRYFFRFGASIPPLVLSVAVRKLNVILEFTGVVSFVLNFFMPCILALFTWRRVAHHWGAGYCRTPYTMFCSSPPFIYFSLFYGVGALALCILVLAAPGII
eukprot:TRINITY_DN8089_c0_g1_i2.p1 TRINITY_DN8089_c0_g1~~TRINITY_DN8089_c0_g1_i2.p1  ORF type:complete len:549 (-),score=173.15 TRINITY_DN8089_c0_g1_i2:427-2073(-)